MPITLAKLIDLYVGTAIFACLNLLGMLRRSSGGPPPGEPRRILLVKFWGIGSILLLSPVMRAVRRRYPESHIALLTLSRNAGLRPLLPAVDEILTLDLESTWRVPLELLRVVRAVRSGRFDLVVDCEFFAKAAAILTFLSGAPRRVGFYRDEKLRQRLYTDGVPFRHDRHVARAFCELLAPLQIPADPADHRLAEPDAAAREEASELLGAARVPGEFVVVNVNASELAYERRWAPAKFAELSRRMAERLDVDVLLVGSPSERGYVSEVEVRSASKRVKSVAGRTSLTGLQALLVRSLLFVTNDSGPLHLAAQSGVPCVALFGPETPDLYGPVGEGHIVFYRRLPCSPCMSVHDMKQVVCHGQVDCLKEIGVDEVMERVVARLAAPAPALAASR